MTYTLSINSSINSYQVKLLESATELQLRGLGDFLVIDSYFEELAQQSGIPYVVLEANETAKSFQALEGTILKLRDLGLRRGNRLVALGGGVIQDIVTFIASIYMRGVEWVYVPTTLMAMIDSCIGGKSSINVGVVKNLVGTFRPPVQITINPEFVRTLPEIEIMSGLAEAAKICFCKGEESFANYNQLVRPLLSADQEFSAVAVAKLIYEVLSTKIWFIEIDEFDQAERRLLNFGHTWGHALEVATNYAVPHGLAIALGMLASLEFLQENKANYASLEHHCKELLSYIPQTKRIYRLDATQFATSFRADKKHRNDQIHVILPHQGSKLGVAEICYPMDTDSIEKATYSMQQVLETAW